MHTQSSIVVKTRRTLVRIGWALALAALIENLAFATLAQADGPTDPWQPSAAYLAARMRILNLKARQLEQYMDTVERRRSRVTLSPQERYRAWKYRESVEIDGSRHTSFVSHR